MIKLDKSLYGILFVAITGSLSIIFVAFTIKRLNQNRQIDKNVENIPEINSQTINPNKSSWANSGSQVILVFYNSSCQNCRYEIEAIEKNLDSFKNINLLFISDEPKETINIFSRKFLLRDMNTVWWLKMEPEDVYKTFGDTGIPHIWIYNKEGELIKEFRGPTRVEAILEWCD